MKRDMGKYILRKLVELIFTLLFTDEVIVR